MLRKEKRGYRFSKEVEEKLNEIGIYITESEGYMYCDHRSSIYVLPTKEYPSIHTRHYLHQHKPNLEDFIKRIDKSKELAIKAYEIIMQDYKEGETL